MVKQTDVAAREDAPTYHKRLAWVVLAVFAALLWIPEIKSLWFSWTSDPSLSHGPLIPVVVGCLLWAKRDQLIGWTEADWRALLGLLVAFFIYIAAVFADIDFLRPAALISATFCGIWFLGGTKKASICLGPIGFLVFMIPWPTLVVERLAFPLQLVSSAYAALFAGILGVPIHKEGVSLFVQADQNARPVYSIVVAQQCSGLTSLAVLLALSYLVGYFTPVRIGWRALLVGAVIPIAIVTNATRLTIILMLGAHGHVQLAQWVHDHEGPVLICICSIILLNVRRCLISRSDALANTETGLRSERDPDVSFQAGDIEPDPARSSVR